MVCTSLILVELGGCGGGDERELIVLHPGSNGIQGEMLRGPMNWELMMGKPAETWTSQGATETSVPNKSPQICTSSSHCVLIFKKRVIIEGKRMWKHLRKGENPGSFQTKIKSKQRKRIRFPI